MVKFEVFEKEEIEVNKVTKLRLKEAAGSILLQAVNDDGILKDDSVLLEITEDGYLRLWDSVNKKLGLKLDDEGELMYKEDDNS